MHILNSQHTFRRRGVAILVAVSVSAILIVLVGGLLFGVMTTERQRIASVAEADLFGLENLGVKNAKLLIAKGDTGTPVYETNAGKVAILTMRPPNDQERDTLYKTPLIPRDGDTVLRLLSQMPFKGQAVYMESTYIVNTTPQQQRCMRIHSRRGNVADMPQPALPADDTESE